MELIHNLAAVKPVNESDIYALGVRVFDSLCADLAPSLPETEDDEGLDSPRNSLHVDVPEVMSTESSKSDRSHVVL